MHKALSVLVMCIAYESQLNALILQMLMANGCGNHVTTNIRLQMPKSICCCLSLALAVFGSVLPTKTAPMMVVLPLPVTETVKGLGVRVSGLGFIGL